MQHNSNKPGRKGVARVVAATGYSAQGLHAAWRSEAAFRQEVVLFVCSLPLAAWLAPSLWIFVALVAAGLLVLLVEILNSAIEAVVDLASPERHPLAGRAKDMGSAAVFIALALFVCVWVAALLARIG